MQTNDLNINLLKVNKGIFSKTNKMSNISQSGQTNYPK
jgi:hypothetical protein